MTQSQPPITWTTHTLPFEKLAPRDFERLCLWLVEREGYEHAEHLGAAGSEQGRDIIAWREDELWVFQCKRVQRFGPKAALAEVEKVLALLEAERPVGLVFLVTCDVSANTRQKVRERCTGKMECYFWAGTELDEKVKRHPDIVEEFFQADRDSTAIVAEQLILKLEGEVGEALLRELKKQLQLAVRDLNQQVTVTGDGNIVGDNNQIFIIKNADLRKALVRLVDERARPRPFPVIPIVSTVLIIAILVGTVVYFGGIPVVLRTQPAPAQLAFPPASGDETLIIIAPFAGSLSDFEIFPERYIRDALRERVDRLTMDGNPARLEMWTNPLTTQREARTVGKTYSATLVIWGEFDDVGGICTFVEIMREVPQPDIQQSGNRLPLVTLPSEQTQIKRVSRECLVEGLPHQADYLATLSLGMIQLIQQQRDQAEESFTWSIESVQLESDCQQDAHQAYYWRGFVRTLQEDFPEAIKDLEQALSLKPDFELALAQRGIAYLAIGQVNAAQADFEAALALIYPEDQMSRAALLSNIGLTLEMQDEFDEALKCYEQSWQINRERDDLIAQALDLGHLGSLYQHQKEWKTALGYHTQALELCQQAKFRQCEAVALGNIGLIHYKKRELDTALELFHEALAIDESIGYSLGQGRQLVQIGLVYLEKQDPETALEFFKQGLVVYEEVGSLYGQAQAQIGVGLAEDRRGNTEAALLALQEALRLLETISSPEADAVRQIIQQAQS